jgi:hypothetical protein
MLFYAGDGRGSNRFSIFVEIEKSNAIKPDGVHVCIHVFFM